MELILNHIWHHLINQALLIPLTRLQMKLMACSVVTVTQLEGYLRLLLSRLGLDPVFLG